MNTHYPSWGSKTRRWWRWRRINRRAHYPSWGSKTRGEAYAAVPCDTRLITLMGIENLEADPGSGGLRRDLITPHGDRKRPTPSSECASAGLVSLPLMGIENCSRRALGRTWRILTHYPSWGSKTTSPSREPDTIGDLITPHGDRKHDSSLVTPSSSQSAHYPSWGSKTPARAPSHSRTHAHYPSWGSKTARPQLGPLADLPSLPLMGIENTAARV